MTTSSAPRRKPRRDSVGFAIGLFLGYAMVVTACLVLVGVLAALVGTAWWLL